MNKSEFINKLEKTLVANNVPDIDEIIYEYEQHFDFKIADGYPEDEIASKLGDPVALANQFVTDKAPEQTAANTSSNKSEKLTEPNNQPIISEEPKNPPIISVDNQNPSMSSIEPQNPSMTSVEPRNPPIISAASNIPPKTLKKNKALITIGLIFTDIFAVLLFIPLFAWVAILGITGIACIILSGLLMFNGNFQNLLPSIPMASAILFSLILILFAIFAALGTLYCFFLFKQLTRAYIRWHQNTMAYATGKPVYPSLAKYPRLDPRLRRRLRVVALSSLILFIVLFITAFAVSALSAGALEFWHAWGWFQ